MDDWEFMAAVANGAEKPESEHFRIGWLGWDAPARRQLYTTLTRYHGVGGVEGSVIAGPAITSAERCFLLVLLFFCGHTRGV